MAASLPAFPDAERRDDPWDDLLALVETLSSLNDLIDAKVCDICRIDSGLAIHGHHTITKQ